jgi:hypothetical protein
VIKDRGKEWDAERLTGKRAQSGKLPGGGPRFTYEVMWKVTGGNKWANTFEPADCLIGWEAEMKKVDEDITRRATQTFLKPVKEATAAKEAASKRKAEELTARRDRLLRKKRRQEARGEEVSDAEDSDEEDGSQDDDLPGTTEELAAELLTTMEQLHELGHGIQGQGSEQRKEGAATEASAPAASTTKGKKQGPSRVWLAFDWATQKCKLPHPQDGSRVCGAPPGRGTGTSGHRTHLTAFHAEEWVHIQMHGKVKTTPQMIKDAFAAKTDISKPSVGNEDRDELHRLTALWISKCGRPQAIVEDTELQTLLARILELCQARLRYTLPCAETVANYLMLLGSEGKALGRDFIVRLLKSGVKPTISGDLWSDGGMGLFGIYAHGITDTWSMEKALIGLIACSTERHTADNIRKWTVEALEGMDMKPDLLMAPAVEGSPTEE